MKIWKQVLVSLILAGAAFLAWQAFYPGAREVLARAGLESLAIFGSADGSSQQAGGAPARGGGQGGRQGGAQGALVAVAPVSEGVVNDRLTAIGSGQAVRSVSVRALVSGQIAEIPVRPGSKVERGDVLIRLDAAEEELAVERARLDVTDAQAKAERLQSLVASRAVSNVEADQAQNAFDTAKVALREAELALSRRTVTAPISGSLGILAVDVGDYVTNQTEIASIDDRSEILVEFFVPERFTAGMQMGKTISATAISRPGETFEGSISAVDNRVDEASRTLRVRALIPNPDDVLRAGMSFEVTVAFKGESWPAIDPLAIQWDSTGAYVWRVVEGKAERIDVAIIQRNSDAVLVKAALEAGDVVVTEGVQSVRPGAAVTILGGAAPTQPEGEPTAQTTLPQKPAQGSGA